MSGAFQYPEAWLLPLAFGGALLFLIRTFTTDAGAPPPRTDDHGSDERRAEGSERWQA